MNNIGDIAKSMDLGGLSKQIDSIFVNTPADELTKILDGLNFGKEFEQTMHNINNLEVNRPRCTAMYRQ